MVRIGPTWNMKKNVNVDIGPNWRMKKTGWQGETSRRHKIGRPADAEPKEDGIWEPNDGRRRDR